MGGTKREGKDKERKGNRELKRKRGGKRRGTKERCRRGVKGQTGDGGTEREEVEYETIAGAKMINAMWKFFLPLRSYIHSIYLLLCVCMHQSLNSCACKCLMTTCRRLFSPTTMRDLGLNSGSLGNKHLYTLRCLSQPSPHGFCQSLLKLK